MIERTMIQKGWTTTFFCFAIAYLATLVDAGPYLAKHGSSVEVKRHLARKTETKNLEPSIFREDVDFWSRLMDGMTNSIALSPSSTPPTRPSQPPAPPSPPSSQQPAVVCDTEASITCVDEAGNPCFEIVPPGGACDSGDSLQKLRFRVEFCTCNESRNTQEEFLSTCVDEGPLPTSDGDLVRFTCADVENESLYFSDTVQGGDEIIIVAPDDNFLPDKIACSVFTEQGDLLQSFTINISGQVDLSLTDKFGSLSLESCDDLDCIQEVTYTYSVENKGTVPLTVTKFDRSRNGDLENFLSDLSPAVISPGTAESVSESEKVDTCIGEEYFTVIDVVSIPSEGEECPSQADYFFPVLDGCLVNVQIECKAEDGIRCSDLRSPSENEDCLLEVDYEYEIENVGTGIMDITRVERTRNGETVSLIGSLDVTSLNPGGSTTIIEKDTLNLCIEAELSTDILVEADPPSNIQCADEDMYKLNTGPPCDISVELACSSLGGLDCTNIEGESMLQCDCKEDCVQDLVYRYTAASCAVGLVGCGDSGANELTADITISNGAERIFFEGRVQIDDDVVISDGGKCLPDSLYALISSPGDQPTSQAVVIDSSCAGGVSLLDSFGAFEFIGYTCGDGIPHNCYLDVEYNITTYNDGTTLQSITNWIFDLNGEISGPGIALPVLEPNKSFSKIEPAEIELCTEAQYAATANVVTGGLSDETECEASDELSFGVLLTTPSPSPSPTTVQTNLSPTTCQFQMDIECVPPFGMTSCNATPPPVEQCSGRPLEMGFLYNGGDCSNSWNVQGAEGKFFCNDFSGGPPTKIGEKSYIVVTDLDGETTFHSDYVAVGSLFILSDDGNRFPANQLISIYKTNNTDDPSGILQSVQYHSSCSSGLFLKDRFGASQLVQWVNEDQGIVSCFANQTFNLDIAIPIDIQGGPATITGLTIASNVDPFFFNLTDKVSGIEAGGGEVIETSIAIPIDLTEKIKYSLLITLTAVTTTGVICSASELTSFVAGYPLPPMFPTGSPSQSPLGLR